MYKFLSISLITLLGATGCGGSDDGSVIGGTKSKTESPSSKTITLSINGKSGVKQAMSSDESLVISGNSNTITVSGKFKKLTISGRLNVVSVTDQFTEAKVTGDDNSITVKKNSKVSDSGSGNQINKTL